MVARSTYIVTAGHCKLQQICGDDGGSRGNSGGGDGFDFGSGDNKCSDQMKQADAGEGGGRLYAVEGDKTGNAVKGMRWVR